MPIAIVAAVPASPIKATPFVAGLSLPVEFVQHPTDPTVQFVVQQGGRIRTIKSGVLQPTDFLDLSSVTRADGERGLLGLAFAPDYATSGRFYVNFTNNPLAAAGDTVIARFTRSAGNP